MHMSKMETRSRRSTVSRFSPRSTSAVEYPDAPADINNSAVSRPGSTPPQAQPFVADVLGEGASTPLRTRGLEQLRQRIEEELGKAPATPTTTTIASPGLTRLRNTPGRGLKEKQQQLIEKHEHIRQNTHRLNVGGGVTLWPNMRQMRLSGREIVLLVLTCLVLVALMGYLFFLLHGGTMDTIMKLRSAVTAFSKAHPIRNTGLQKDLKSSVLAWHADFRQLLQGVELSLNVSRPSAVYQVYMACYVLALCVLVYFLADSMCSQNKLSPGRIKKWVCLLVVVAQWTAMLFFMFIAAYRLESAIIANVMQLSEKLGELLERDLDVSSLAVAVQYWRGRCLSVQGGSGVVQVLGLLPLQDMTLYLGYYLLPLLTLLLTPVLRLCLAVRALYTSSGHADAPSGGK